MKRLFHCLCFTAVLLCADSQLFSEPAGPVSVVSKAAEALRETYRENPELSIGARTCVVGGFTWSDSGVGTAFSEYLRGLVEDALMEIDEFDLVIPPDGSVFFGREAEQFITGEDASHGGRLPVSAFRLYGTYEVRDGKAVVQVKVFSEVFSRLMSEFALFIPMENIPPGVEIYPSNLDVISDVSENVGDLYSGTEDFQIFISTNRGEGGVFKEGEYLKLFLLASRDSYIKLYHIDVKGKTALIFPNRFEKNNYLPGGEILEFPGKRSPFQFRIVPPYGTEIIKVVASTRQFSSLEKDFSDLGYATRGLFIEESEQETREIMAEGLVHFTILGKE